MSPFEHGEVFVLDDGGEVDLDLGNYERFLDLTLTRDNNLTTGKVYQHVLERERKGDYLGKTVQVVPHVTDAIQDWIERVARIPVDGRPGPPDVCVIELGGTVGDIESAPFVEALRQFQFRVGAANFCSVHVSLVPILGVVGEQKTKPTQHSVATLRSLGINPAFLACRCSDPLEEGVRDKLALFCQVPPSHVLTMHDVANIWHVPLLLASQGAHAALCDRLGLGGAAGMDLTHWRTALAERWDALGAKVSVAMVGKYTGELVGVFDEGGGFFYNAIDKKNDHFPPPPIFQACPTPTCPSSKPCNTPASPPTGAWTWCGWTPKSWSPPRTRASAARRGPR
jgi:CTP synthase